MIEIKNLCKNYGDFKALENLNLSLKKGSIFGLLGVNGAGKTTLLSILNGLIQADSGQVYISGLELNANLNVIRSKSSFIPQSLAFYERLSVKENLNFFSSILNIPLRNRNKNLNRAIAITSLEGLLGQLAGTLSGGQKRSLNIAIGLLNSPDLIYFDEPTVGVDPHSREVILNAILRLKQEGKTIIYTSHYMHEIEKICDDVAIIHQGKIVKHGPLAQLLSVANKVISIDVIEFHHSLNQVPSFLKKINCTTFSINKKSDLAQAVAYIEQQQIIIRKINFEQSDLEKFFIGITRANLTRK